MSNIKFFPMDHPNFWSRPQYLKTGYTFRNGGGEGDIVFTLLEDFDEEKCNDVKYYAIIFVLDLHIQKHGMIHSI